MQSSYLDQQSPEPQGDLLGGYACYAINDDVDEGLSPKPWRSQEYDGYKKTFIASVTQKVRLGTGICLVPQRQPVYTAKMVADVDFLSGGRVDFGVGIGWLKEEFDNLGMDFSTGVTPVKILKAHGIAAKLGVEANWVVSNIAGTDVGAMDFDQMMVLLRSKVEPLPKMD